MSPRTPQQFENIRTEKKQIIMDAALEVFAQKSYHGASISQIAKVAGVSKGLMYNYFKNKEALISELLIVQFNRIFDSHKININNIDDHELVLFIEKSFSLLDENPEFWKLLFGLTMQTEVLEIIMPQMEKVLEPFLVGFTKYFASKGFDNPIAETQFFWGIMDGLSMDYITMGLPKEYCIQRIKDIYKID